MFTQSERRSPVKHVTALGISDQSVRRILCVELQFRPCKMIVVQQLHELDWINHVTSCQAIVKNGPVNLIVLSSYETHFHLLGYVNKQNFSYRRESNPL